MPAFTIKVELKSYLSVLISRGCRQFYTSWLWHGDVRVWRNAIRV